VTGGGVPTIGVEEEYQLVEPGSRELRSTSRQVLAEARRIVAGADGDRDQVQPELYASQIEIGTPVCSTLDEVEASLRGLRAAVAEAAGRTGTRIAAAGTHPFSDWRDQRLSPKQRYRNLVADHRRLAEEEVVFGCHVHVAVPGREAAVAVLNRVGPWLAALIALGANSPFWLGDDTGFASWRTELWRRWPLAGTPSPFASRGEYDELLADLVATGAVREPTKLYFDVRPSERYDTVEFRVADVQTDVERALLQAGLCRALVVTALAEAERGEPLPAHRPELLLAAKWRAARSGLDAELVDLPGRRAAPAAEVVQALLEHVRPALEQAGDAERVDELAGRVLADGDGAGRQRAVLARAGKIEAVVDDLIERTA
jgi:carboxylate-amine ligase